MMPPDTATAKPPPKDDSPPSSATTRKAAPPSSSAKQPPPEQQPLKCPRCDSSNTKFCYYNNYSLTQPRHFCKTCRRYWTNGGALRNVPIGGGCRKNKKVKSSSSSTNTNLHHLSVVDPKDCSDFGGGLNLKYFSGLTPAVDFHLPGLPAFPARVHSSSTSGGPYGQFPPPFSDVPPPPPSSSFLTTPPPPPPRFPLDSCSGSLLGFNYPLSSFSTNNNPNTNNQGDQIGTNLSINSSIASSIESLSSINQDLHWKLQQQRLSMLFGSNGENTQKEVTTVVPTPVSNIETAPDHHHQVVKPQHAPFLVQNHDNNSLTKQADVPGNSRKDGDAATEWFFGNSYATTDSDGNGDGNGSGWSSGIQAWSGGGRNLNQFSALP